MDINQNTNNQKVYVTAEGLKKLEKEYAELTKVKRKEIAEKLARARELGDLSENSAWEQARSEQSFVEGRIQELEDILKNAVTVNVEGHGSQAVKIGSKVKVHLDGDEEEFTIVGAPEANPQQKKISHESPLGMALLGKKVGDKVEVEAPIGKINYTILAIA